MSGEEVKSGLRDAFTWHGDRTDQHRYADVTGWWRRADLLGHLGPALADMFAGEQPTVVLGPESRGCLLGPLVALHLGVGFVEVRKDRVVSSDSDVWLQRTTPPDYQDRHLTLGFRKNLVNSGDRVLFVDDWIETADRPTAPTSSSRTPEPSGSVPRRWSTLWAIIRFGDG